MLSVDEARARVLSGVPRLPVETAALAAARGRVLARAVRANRDLPAFDSTARDGYAVRAKDTTGARRAAPRVLKIIEDIPAGRVPTRRLGPGEAARIFTGAVLPNGADAIVQQEDAARAGDAVRIFVNVPRGKWIRPAGEDVRRGEVVVPAGRRLRPGDVGMLAALGVTRVPVARRPRVAILATGDEVAAPGRPVRRGQVRDANSHALAASVEAAGGEPRRLGIVRDRLPALLAAIRRGLAADALILSAGVSVGEHDLVRSALARVGIDLNFWQVSVKPGRPLAFAMARRSRRGGPRARPRRVPVFALPGNPVSALVTFHLFVEPVLRAMQGEPVPSAEPWVRATLLEKLSGGRRREYVRGILAARKGRLSVRSTGNQDSHLLSSMVKADCFIVVPENSPGLRAGTEVSVIPLGIGGAFSPAKEG